MAQRCDDCYHVAKTEEYDHLGLLFLSSAFWFWNQMWVQKASRNTIFEHDGWWPRTI